MITRRQFNIAAGGLAIALSAPAVLKSGASAQGKSSLERVKSSGVLRIGGIPDGAPGYQKALTDGQWRGFYVDLAQQLAKDLNVELSIVETTWGNSVLDLQSDKIDVFFGLNPTPARAEIIDFSGPIFKNAFTLVANNKLAAQTWDDLNKPEVRIAVDAGSAQDAAVTKHAPNAQIVRLKTTSDGTAALQAGRVDAQCLVVVLALTLLSKNPSVGKLIVPTPIDATTSNAGFRREDDKSWMQFVDSWITKYRDNGFVQSTVVRNLELVGVKTSDFPAGLTI